MAADTALSPGRARDAVAIVVVRVARARVDGGGSRRAARHRVDGVGVALEAGKV